MWFNKLWVLLDLGSIIWHSGRIFAVLEAARKRFSGIVIKDVEVVSYVKVEESGVFVLEAVLFTHKGGREGH